MLRWMLIFLVLAVVSGLFGFTTLATGFAAIAKIIFFLIIAVLAVMLVSGLFRGFR